MTNTEPNLKIMLREGIINCFAGASLSYSTLEGESLKYKIAYTDAFKGRNNVDEEVLSSRPALEIPPANLKNFHTKSSPGQTAETPNAEAFQDKKPITVDTSNSASP